MRTKEPRGTITGINLKAGGLGAVTRRDTSLKLSWRSGWLGFIGRVAHFPSPVGGCAPGEWSWAWVGIQQPGAWSFGGEPVSGVPQRAVGDGKAAAADAPIQLVP